MTKILIVSDTHGQQDRMIRAIVEEQPDLLLHAGDIENNIDTVIPVTAKCRRLVVRGNCDYGSEYKSEIFIEEEGVKILMLHGNNYGHGKCYCNPAQDPEPLYAYAKSMEADVLIHGHTHVPKLIEAEGLLIFNPGSLTLPRGGNAPSYGVMEVENGHILSLVHKQPAMI